MGKISTLYMNNLLNVGFGAFASTFPATLHLGLSTTQPTDAGANITEPTDAAYARVSFANDGVTWDVAAGRGTSNLISLTFPTAVEAWGDVSHFIIMDTATVGEMVAWGALASVLTVGAGDTVVFDPGTITIVAPGTTP